MSDELEPKAPNNTTPQPEYIFDTDDKAVLQRVCKALSAVCEDVCPEDNDLAVRWENIKITTYSCIALTNLLFFTVRRALTDVNPFGAKFWGADDEITDEAHALAVFLNTYFRNPFHVYNPIEVKTEGKQTFVVMNNDPLRLAPQDALAALNTLAKLMNEDRIIITPATRNRPLENNEE